MRRIDKEAITRRGKDWINIRSLMLPTYDLTIFNDF